MTKILLIISRKFKARVLNYDIDSEKLLNNSIDKFLFNTKYIQRKINEGKSKIPSKLDKENYF